MKLVGIISLSVQNVFPAGLLTFPILVFNGGVGTFNWLLQMKTYTFNLCIQQFIRNMVWRKKKKVNNLQCLCKYFRFFLIYSKMICEFWAKTQKVPSQAVCYNTLYEQVESWASAASSNWSFLSHTCSVSCLVSQYIFLRRKWIKIWSDESALWYMFLRNTVIVLNRII